MTEYHSFLQPLVSYLIPGVFSLLILIFFPEHFLALMNWSFLRIKKAHLQFLGKKEEEIVGEIEQAEQEIFEEFAKPQPDSFEIVANLAFLVFCWPLIVFIPTLAIVLDFLYIEGD